MYLKYVGGIFNVMLIVAGVASVTLYGIDREGNSSLVGEFIDRVLWLYIKVILIISLTPRMKKIVVYWWYSDWRGVAECVYRVLPDPKVSGYPGILFGRVFE
jgi:hypothetical protein